MFCPCSVYNNKITDKQCQPLIFKILSAGIYLGGTYLISFYLKQKWRQNQLKRCNFLLFTLQEALTYFLYVPNL